MIVAGRTDVTGLYDANKISVLIIGEKGVCAIPGRCVGGRTDEETDSWHCPHQKSRKSENSLFFHFFCFFSHHHLTSSAERLQNLSTVWLLNKN